ncbi:IclR family transcriptional regulator [Pseudomonas citronellolis]|uniref:IclR family transcriptional regulator n=1 Tax=Pseudomonas citronellolis TaxID=53408 RepID=UPI0020A1B17D|nr:IclR family transcriptional regulator [Pseudomonas citronellolis]MCP1606047.1 DNA-binding IclR family transcriptional regulator [Pseudomonas citronellolis]MCP1656543.1 DNA-binding IclR family transcriptional regulator [Pseudomonas citronellolis]MCP1723572.1 DNA-binding IclR family transcriptional regulator [Pseudomonas citronellolis]
MTREKPIDESHPRRAGAKDVGAVVNAIHILRHLAAAEAPEGVTSIARATGISPSTSFNILRTLSNEQLVCFNGQDKTYQLGLGLSELAVGFIGRSYADLIQPELDGLSLNHNILITLWQLTGDAHIRVIAHSIPPTAHINVALGARLPELAGAAGRCIAAARNLPDAELRRRLTKIRWESPPSFEQFRAEVAQAAERGWGIDQDQLYRGVSTVSSAIVDRERQPRFVISAIGISAQHEQDGLERIGASLRDTTRFIERALFP